MTHIQFSFDPPSHNISILDSAIHDNYLLLFLCSLAYSTLFCLFACVRCGFFFETLPKGQKLLFSVNCSMKLPAETLLEALVCLSSCSCASGPFTSLSVLVRSSLLSFFFFFFLSKTVVHENSLHLLKERTDEFPEMCFV